MANPFPVSGNIEPEAFPHLLVDLHRHGATGSLKVTGSSHPKALYFRGGRILFGSSNDPRDQLGSILIESGKISREQLDDVNVKVGPGNPLAKVLAESGFVNQRELGDAARIKVERILADVLAWESGSFEFEDGVLPKGAVDLKLSTERLLLAAVQRVPDRAFALRHIELRTVLEPTPEADRALTEIRADVWPLLERLDGQRTLKDAIALTRLDEFEAAKTACALLFLGVVQKKAAVSGEELDLAQEAQSGLGNGGHAPFSPPPQPVIAPSRPFAFAQADTEDETEGGADRPFVFPEAAPPPAPDGATEAYRAIAAPQAEQPFVFSESAPALSFTPSFPEAEAEEAEAGEAQEAPSTEPMGFAVSDPSPGLEDAPETPEPTLVLPFASTASAPTFSMPSLAPRVPSDTLPGEQPAAKPAQPLPSPAPMAFERVEPTRPDSTAPSLPEIPLAQAASRPTREDLAALDELLNTSGRLSRGPDRSRSERWEPQFRPATTPPRRAPARTAPSGPSRIPLLMTALVGVVLATAAAWYFFLRQPAVQLLPATPTPRSTTTLAAAPTPTAKPPASTPEPAATATVPPTRPTPAALPTAGPTPLPQATPSPRVTAAAADGRALLRQGALPEAARAFAAALASSRGAHSVQILTACAPETVQKAVGAAGGDELFILPVVTNGRACFRVCWGVYGSRPAADAALATIPAYFRQGGAKPRVSTLGELLP